jgi:hypothetical protein
MLALVLPVVARAQSADSSYTRFELGGTSDVTNERFYEDSFDDTTFTGRRLTGSPEFRSAGIGAFEAAGGRSGFGRFQFRQEVTLGDRLTRSYSRLELRGAPRERVRLAFTPELDVRRDQSFGGDRRELRFRPDGRLRIASADHGNSLELLAGGDWSRASGTSESSTLDRNAGRAWLRWAHQPLASMWESELAYGADVRAFPDSVIRDHFEQHGGLALRRLLPGGGTAALELQADRRSTLYSTVATRDHFWNGRLDASAFVPLHAALTAELWLSLEGYRYDRPDTSVYFDYRVWNLRPAFHWSLARDWGVRVGPRLELLVAPHVVAERYRQVTAVVELERLHGGDWWSFAPAAGWRQYERSAATVSLDEPDLHSSYLYLEGELFADYGLPSAMRLRCSGSARFEQHEDPSQDASSLYFSLDVRRRF